MTTQDVRRPAVPRLSSLDGLRGFASLAVVFTHVGLSIPTQEGSPPGHPLVATIKGLLGVFADGTAAVAIFFVLSGLVLTLPMRNGVKVIDWIAYYPRRIVRLYVPVWGSLLLALLWATLVPRREDPALAGWISDHAAEITRGRWIRSIMLMQTTPLNTPLWSLYYEVAFSLLLPLFVLVAARRSKLWSGLLLAASLGVIYFGATRGTGLMIHLPQFMLGAALAPHAEALKTWLSRRHWSLSTGLGVASFGLVYASGMMSALGGPGTSGWQWLLRAIGALLCVIAFLGARPFAAWGESRVGQWLGTRSFSLYLVHEPLVVSLALLWPNPTYWPFALVAVPASLLLAHFFYLIVERPAHLLSRWIGRHAKSLLSRSSVSAPKEA